MSTASRLIKRALRSAAAVIGADVRGIRHTEPHILARTLALTAPDCVLDVGANSGQYARRLRRGGFRGRIISFEPLAAAHAGLVSMAAHDPAWTIAGRGAIGHERSQGTINVAADSVSSSMLPAVASLRESEGRTRPVAAETVQIYRLDSAPEIPAAGALFLKVDTQGYELEVLRGASGLLRRIHGMQLEMSLVTLYAGAPSMATLLEYVSTLGFELYDMVPGFRDSATGRLLQVDGFFLRHAHSDWRVS